MKIKHVTVTGADDRTSIRRLLALSQDHPSIEWGILVSRDMGGQKRFPSIEWITSFLESCSSHATSLHICGSWLLDVCRGNPSIFESLPSWSIGSASRIQFNLAHQLHKVSSSSFFVVLADFGFQNKSLIFQLDGSNMSLVDHAIEAGFSAFPFYDCSRGNGVVPDSWPKPRKEFSGYAGGLSPKNVKDQLKKIEDVVGDAEIWIDVESGVRDDKDQFSLKLAEQFVSECRDWI